MTISVAIAGARGRLGSVIADVVQNDPALSLHAALTSQSDPAQMRGADVLVDATRLDISESLVTQALGQGLSVVIGTSGWDRARIDALRANMPEGSGVIIAPNFSLGSVLATHLAALAVRSFSRVEIIEAHHASKLDSPSGTAVRTAERIADERGERGDAGQAPGPEQPARGHLVAGVPVHSLRLPGVVAEQRVIFGGEGELLEIRHETLSADAYRPGIRAAILAAPETRGVVVGLGALLGLEGA